MARPRSASPEERAFPFEVFPAGTLSLDDVDLSREVEPELYEREALALQQQVHALQIRNYLDKERVVLVFEGWDAAGKGGAIRRLTALMDPRGFRVWPIAAPNQIEREQHWLWRFWTRIPARGELVVFDRSWYGRVLVERVEKLARKPEWRRAYDEINAFERLLTLDGVRVLKLFLHIDAKTQLKRFKAREKDPVKRYKLDPEDWRNRKRAKDYAAAFQDMLDRTHRPDAPWRIIAANDKRHARLEVLRAAIRLLEGKTP